MKQCSRCGKFKPSDEFPKSRGARCKDCKHAQYVVRRADNLERERAKGREQSRRWREANRELARQYDREAKRRWREANREEHNRSVREWRRRNPEIARARDCLYDSRRRQLLGTPDQETKTYAAILRGDVCAFCGTREGIQLDHIDPVIHGGQHSWENLTALCRSCNAQKRDRPLLHALSYVAEHPIT